MCNGNCGKCNKAEFETTDVQVESLAERSGMIVDDGWISVDDKKPKILEHVICTNTLGRVFEACYWSEGEFASVYMMGKFGVMAKPDDSVTHWRPLPPPVK